MIRSLIQSVILRLNALPLALSYLIAAYFYSSLAFGIRERERRMLFEHLPLLSADMNTCHEVTMMTGGGGDANYHQILS